MKQKLSIATWAFIILCLLAACNSSAGELISPSPTEIKQSAFAELLKLPSDGLMHDPYGWDNLYGSKEVPAIWWQREPRDAVAGEQICVNVAVGKILEDKDVWIVWTKNGIEMEPVLCQPRANLHVDGIEKVKCCGFLSELETGDIVEYAICVGTNGKAEKCLGTFTFAVSQWEHVEIFGMTNEKKGAATFLGTARDVPVAIHAEVRPEGVLSLQIEDSDGAQKAMEPGAVEINELRFQLEQDGRFSLYDHGTLIVSGSGIELLTDGINICKVRLIIDTDPSENFYGFGMKYDALNQRGKTVENYCVNWYKDQRGETYTPVPYYFVPNKYGLFLDSTYYSSFEMATKDHKDSCVIEVNTDRGAAFSVPIYLFPGDNKHIASAYASVAGQAVLPPVWAFGPWISANEWNKQSEVMEQLGQTLEQKIGTTVLVIEAWSDEQTFYTFNDSQYEATDGGEALGYEDFTFTGRWPDPKGMVEELHKNDVKCLLWQIPVLKYSTEATVQSVQDQNYAIEQGYILQHKDGSIYRLPGGTWFGNSLLVDFTNQDASEWFLEKRRYLLEDIGIDGFKTDGGEFVWGRNVVAADGTTGSELRNAYPDLYAQAYYDFGNTVTGEIVTFSRAGGSSMQTHPLCWVGDQNSSFSAFQDAIRASLSTSMSGIPFVAWDIAGFSGDVPTAALYQRGVAQGAFSPVMQIHSETPGDPVPSQARTPWNMAQRKEDTACLDTYRYYANLRMNLLPYIYTEAKWAAETGEPMMRSMVYAFPEDKKAAEFEFQYMFGRNMLVAPVTTPNAKKVEVYLPEGDWFNFFTGDHYNGGTHIVAAAVNEIPVFVRGGTIIPLNLDKTGQLASYVGNSCEAYQNLSYMVFPGEGSYVWYDYVDGQEIIAVFDGESLTVDGKKETSYFVRGE